MYLLHVRFDSVGLLSAPDIPWQVYIKILTDFDPCSHRKVKQILTLHTIIRALSTQQGGYVRTTNLYYYYTYQICARYKSLLLLYVQICAHYKSLLLLYVPDMCALQIFIIIIRTRYVRATNLYYYYTYQICARYKSLLLLYVPDMCTLQIFIIIIRTRYVRATNLYYYYTYHFAPHVAEPSQAEK